MYIETIKKILLAFEQSSTTIQYDKIYLYNDGPKKRKQITVSFGITEYGNLKKLVQSYCDSKGKFSSDFLKYIDKIGKEPLADNQEFISLLKRSAGDNVMKQCQEAAFDDMYINPALKWCEKSKILLPLSKLVIADSFLHSGSILSSLRNKFAEKLPSLGGDEKNWINSYCIVRRDWLENHSLKILNKTVYRPDMFISLIEEGDWNLSKKNYTANGVNIA